jgi:hypothetical protein
MTSSTSVESELSQSPGWLAALEEARHGFAEGGLPIGACVVSKTGKILGRGRNRLVQNGTPQMHVCASDLFSLQAVVQLRWLRNTVHILRLSPANAMPCPLELGRDVRPRILRPPACGRVPRRDHLHDALALRHVHRRNPALRVRPRRDWRGGIRVEAEGHGRRGVLESKGVEVVDLGNSECKEMMREFVEANLELCRTEPWFVDD